MHFDASRSAFDARAHVAEARCRSDDLTGTAATWMQILCNSCVAYPSNSATSEKYERARVCVYVYACVYR